MKFLKYLLCVIIVSIVLFILILLYTMFRTALAIIFALISIGLLARMLCNIIFKI